MDKRAKIRVGLSPLYTPYYDGLCNLLGPEWQPYSGLRTWEEQDALYAKGGVTNAKGGESPHNYGCASDWCIWEGGKTPIWPAKDDKRWEEYTTAIWKMGLKAGADFGDYPHNEVPIFGTWKRIGDVYAKEGMTEAMKFIELIMKKAVVVK